MNDNEKVIAALNGAKETGSDGGDKARIAELERELEMKNKELQTERVERGRLKKVEDELAKLKSGNVVKTAVDKMSDDELGDTPREFVEKSGIVAANLVEQAEGRQAEELKKLRAEIAERDNNSFFNAIGTANQKFFADVGPGGDKTAMWEQFKSNNRETLAAIMQTHDTARFNQMVGSFYREIGVPNPSGVQGVSVAPDPRSTVGGQNGVGAAGISDGQQFTQDQYLAALDKAETDFRVTGDLQAYRAATDALNRALNEGRVK